MFGIDSLEPDYKPIVRAVNAANASAAEAITAATAALNVAKAALDAANKAANDAAKAAARPTGRMLEFAEVGALELHMEQLKGLDAEAAAHYGTTGTGTGGTSNGSA